MSLSNTTVKQKYAGDGIVTSFAITFDFILNSSECKVILRDETDPANITETLLAEGVDYNLTGASPPGIPFPTTVEMVVAPTATQELLIYRDMPLTQLLSYLESSTFRSLTVEEALDKLTAISQELAEKATRAISLSRATDATLPSELPEPEADKYWQWNATGDSLQYKTAAEIVEDVVGLVLLKANNLSDVANAATSRTNLGVGDADNVTHNSLTLVADVAAGGVDSGGRVEFETFLDGLGLGATPSNPAAGRLKLYFKNDGNLYKLDESGVETQVDAGASGEANTASNQGAGGVGVFKQKTGVDLEFKNINADAGADITVTDDVANNEIDLGLSNTTVTPGSYTTADITVDAKGRITAAANGAGVAGANTSLSNLTNPTAINETLLPNANNTLDIGAVGAQWRQVYGKFFVTTDTSNGYFGGTFNGGPSVTVRFMSGESNAALDTALTEVKSGNQNNFGTGATGDVQVGSGSILDAANASDTGDTIITVGTTAGAGARGKVKIKDGSEGTAGQVLTSTGVDGEASWAAPAGQTAQERAETRFKEVIKNVRTYPDPPTIASFVARPPCVGTYGAVIPNAGGSSANVYVSFNGGATFVTKSTGAIAPQFEDCAYGNSTYVLVNNDNGINSSARIFNSTDEGDTWTGRTLGALNDEWTSIAFGNSTFVAVGNDANVAGNAAARSTDNGNTWTQIAPAEANNWRYVSFGNGVFVAVANSGTNRIMRSTDNGASWSAVAHPVGTLTFGRPIYANGKWYATASQSGAPRTLIVSTDDGASWSTQNIYPSNANIGSGVAIRHFNVLGLTNGAWITGVSYNGTAETEAINAFVSFDNGVTWETIVTFGLNYNPLIPGTSAQQGFNDAVLLAGRLFYQAGTPSGGAGATLFEETDRF
jgi:hypothetical protein